MWPLIVGAAASLAGNALSSLSQKSANERNLENQWQMFNAQKDYQNFLNENADSMKRRSLEKAGFNLNMDNGGYPSLTPPASPLSNINASSFDFSNMLQGALLQSQIKNIDADTNLKNSQAQESESSALLKSAQEWALRQKTPEEVKQIREETNRIIKDANQIEVNSSLIDATIGKVLSETTAQEYENAFTLETKDLRIAKLATEVAYMYEQGELSKAQTAVAYKSLNLISAQIRNLISQANLNDRQANYVYYLGQIASVDAEFAKHRSFHVQQFIHNELELSDKQVEQIDATIDNIVTSTEYAPLTAITSAAAGLGVAVGGAMSGLKNGLETAKALKPRNKIGF